MESRFNVFFLFIIILFIQSQCYSQYYQVGNKLVGIGVIGAAQQSFSLSLSSDGNTLAVGGPSDNHGRGAVWIYTCSGGNWKQTGNKLVGTGDLIKVSFQGSSVSLSSDGKRLATGVFSSFAYSGAVWIFEYSGSWSQMGNNPIGVGSIDGFVQGYSVSLNSNGNTLAFGGNVNSNDNGEFWAYTLSGGNWKQVQNKQVGTNGSTINGQGTSVSFSSDGKRLSIGQYSDNLYVGAAWVFEYSQGKWLQMGNKLVGTGAISNSSQGSSISLSSDGNTLAVGGREDNFNTGAVWVYTFSGGNWSQIGNKLSGDNFGDEFGISVSLSSDGKILAVGESGYNNNKGAACIYNFSNGKWQKKWGPIFGTGAVGNASQGITVSLSSDGQTLAIGGVADNNSAGAAWIFKNCGPFITNQPISQTVCGMNFANLSVSAIGNPPFNYHWNTGDLTNSIVATQNGLYSVTVGNICDTVTSDTATLLFINSLPTVTGLATKNPICIGQSTTLSGTGAYNYIWNDSISNGESFTPIITSNYTVIGMGFGGCTDTSSVLVTVYPIPTVTGTALPNPVCQGQQTTLMGYGAFSYSWSDGAINGTSFIPSSSTVYTLTGSGIGGCTDTASLYIEVDPGLGSLKFNDTSIVCGELYTLDAGKGYSRYQWQDGSISQTFTLSKAGAYYVTISDACGSVTDTSNITLKKAILPNVFTPNRDGKNDELYIGNYVSGGKITLSNRWGDSVFHSGNYSNDWKAENLQDGIYFCELETGCENLRGWVEVIR